MLPDNPAQPFQTLCYFDLLSCFVDQEMKNDDEFWICFWQSGPHCIAYRIQKRYRNQEMSRDVIVWLTFSQYPTIPTIQPPYQMSSNKILLNLMIFIPRIYKNISSTNTIMLIN